MIHRPSQLVPTSSNPFHQSFVESAPLEMSTNQPRVTRSTRANARHRSRSPNATASKPAAKRQRVRPARGTLEPGSTSNVTADPDPNHLPTPSGTQQRCRALNRGQPIPPSPAQDKDLELSEITLQNYHQVKRHWPLGRIQDQLAKQSSSNHKLSAAVIAEGQAILEQLEHSLHMIAMVSGVDISKLKRTL